MLKKSFFTFVFSLIFVSAFAGGISLSNLSSIEVDNVSDHEIQNFVDKFTNAGYDIADIDKVASSKGMSSAQIEKLKQRIQKLSQSRVENTASAGEITNKVRTVENNERNEENEKINEQSIVFGANLFRNKNVSFATNNNMATPKTYQLGPGDELSIYIYGYSETSMTLVVSPEGTIKIPNVGLLQVSGMTIENAELAIKKKLSSIYSSINSGNTKVAISLSNVRSIMVYILGEVDNPGTYTISSLSSVLNALYACGGPNPQTGSMREIKIIRNNKEIAVVDLYEFLLKGKMSKNLTLQDQDVIYIPVCKNQVTVNGAMYHNGIFEIKEGETLSDLIGFCGGFTKDAYKDRISVVRINSKEKTVADVPQELFSMFKPQSGDVFTIDNILDKFSNRVQIVGGVQRPGSYALTEGMTLKDLLKKADGLLENVFMERATISRLRDDLSPEIISFKVSDLLDNSYNIELKKEDVVTFGTKDEFEESKNISIEGQVMKRGVYPYSENMTLKDLIFMAKGFTIHADKENIELTRRILDDSLISNSKEMVSIYNLSLNETLSGGDADFRLEPNDVVSVRTIDGLVDLGSIEIRGEIKSPGFYAITSKEERISDIIRRAGSFTNYAYLEGAFLIRKSNRSEAELKRDLKLIEALNDMSDGIEKENLRNSILSRTDMVGIKLDEIYNKPGSKTDLYVNAGDIIYVPRELQTVSVSGAVQVPSMVIYDTKKFKDYVNGAGGFNENADKKHSYIAYSNGSIGATKRFLWFKRYPKVEPGAHIYIPEKPVEESHSKENMSFMVTLLGSIATVATTVVSLIIVSK